MNLFRSEEHARNWEGFDEAMVSALKPLAEWADIFDQGIGWAQILRARQRVPDNGDIDEALGVRGVLAASWPRDRPRH